MTISGWLLKTAGSPTANDKVIPSTYQGDLKLEQGPFSGCQMDEGHRLQGATSVMAIPKAATTGLVGAGGHSTPQALETGSWIMPWSPKLPSND